jgi:hypothetical protein
MTRARLLHEINDACQHLPEPVVIHIDAAVHAILESSVTYDEMLEALRGVLRLVEYVPMTRRAVREAREENLNA